MLKWSQSGLEVTQINYYSLWIKYLKKLIIGDINYLFTLRPIQPPNALLLQLRQLYRQLALRFRATQSGIRHPAWKDTLHEPQ